MSGAMPGRGFSMIKRYVLQTVYKYYDTLIILLCVLFVDSIITYTCFKVYNSYFFRFKIPDIVSFVRIRKPSW